MNETQSYRQRLEPRMTDIAERLIASEGLGAVQARRVAQEADCSVGTLYNVFGDLDGLIIAVNLRTLNALGDKLETALRGVQGQSRLEDRLIALALAYRDFAYQHNLRWRALFEYRMQPDKEVPDDYHDKRANLLLLIERCLVGYIDDTVARASAARALFSAAHGIVWLALESKLDMLGPEETERQVRFIVGAAAQGIEARLRLASGT